MEGEAGNDSVMQLLALTFPGYGDELSLPYEHVQNHAFLPVAESSYTVSSSQWMDYQNYMNYLIQNQSSVSPREIAYSSNPGDVAGSDHFDNFSLNVQTLKVEHPRPRSDDSIVTNLTSTEYWNYFQASSNQRQKGLCSPVKRGSRVASRSRGGSSTRKAATSDQLRRAKIKQRIEALQELLPSPKEGGGQASVLDDIIDHIKYLQIRVKDLSQSRLAGEPSSYPFVFLEGYGHYTIEDNMLKEPLEEQIGKLLEVNPLAVSGLLQSRGLAIMPNCF